jgi:hypothetical protein
MGTITILCPKTGQRISTGVEIDPRGFEAVSDIRSVTECWACGGRHVWSKRWATLSDEPAGPRGEAPKGRARVAG